MTIIEAVLLLFAGVGVFVVGINMLGDGLERSAGVSLKKMLGGIGSNRLVGAGIGACVTAIIQSSSATTVMTIGFVNAGIMSLYQGIAIVLGAGIGTTITGIIVSLQNLLISDFIMLLTLVGVILTFFKNEKCKQIGGILSGFGLIFVGLDIMGNSLKNSTEINAFFINLFKIIDFPLLLILVGMIFTALIQSSSAATGIFITLAGASAGATPVLALSEAVFLVMGANIGTCITGVLASIGASPNARRVSFIQVLSKVFGMVVFTAIVWPLQNEFVNLLLKIPGGNAMQLAWFHVAFNVVTTFALLPFINQLVKLSYIVVKDKREKDEGLALRFVDERLIKTPAIAMMQVKKEIEYMAELAKANIVSSFEAIKSDAKKISLDIAKNEEVIDFTNKEITKYLIKLSSHVEESDERRVGSYFHVLNDLERIGDHADNFSEISLELQKKGLKFSEEGKKGLAYMMEKVLAMFDIATQAFSSGRTDDLKELTQLENEVDELKKKLSDLHYSRLADGKCIIEHSPYYTSIVAGLERVADHLVNVGYSVLNPTGSQK